jgi:hypothetical protein
MKILLKFSLFFPENKQSKKKKRKMEENFDFFLKRNNKIFFTPQLNERNCQSVVFLQRLNIHSECLLKILHQLLKLSESGVCVKLFLKNERVSFLPLLTTKIIDFFL